jgi:hypothetical protein
MKFRMLASDVSSADLPKGATQWSPSYQSCIEACNTCAEACDYLSSANELSNSSRAANVTLNSGKRLVGAIFRLLALGSRL